MSLGRAITHMLPFETNYTQEPIFWGRLFPNLSANRSLINNSNSFPKWFTVWTKVPLDRAKKLYDLVETMFSVSIGYNLTSI